MLKKIFWGSLILFIAILAGASYWVSTSLEKELDHQIRSAAVQYLEPQNIHLDYKKIKWIWGLPLRVQLIDVNVSQAQFMKAKISELELTADLRGSWIKSLKQNKWDPLLGLKISNPFVQIDLSKTNDKTAAPSASSPATPIPLTGLTDLPKKISLISNLGFKLEIKQLQAQIFKEANLSPPWLEINQVNARLNLENLQSPLQFENSGSLKIAHPVLPFWIPWHLNTNIKYERSAVEISSADFSVLSLEGKLKALYQLDSKSIQLQANSVIPDLAALPLKNPIPEIKSWSGSVQAHVSIQGPLSSLKTQGGLNFKKTILDLNFQKSDISLQGPVKIDLETQFATGKTPKITPIKAHFDLSSTNLRAKDLFQKKSNIPFTVDVQGHITDKINLENLSVKLAQLKTTLRGDFWINPWQEIGSRWPAKFNLELQPTELKGLEQIILPLSKSPLLGSAALNVDFSGELNNFKESQIHIKQLNLNQIQTYIDFKNESLQIQGPLSAQAQAQLLVQKMDVKNGQAQLQIEASNLEMQFKKLFQKTAREKLLLQLTASKKGPKLELNKSSLQTPAGNINLSGRPPLSMEAPLDLNMEAQNLNLNLLKKWLPLWRDLIPEGTATLKSHVFGSMNSADILKSPLNSETFIQLKLKKIILAAKDKQPPPTAAAAAPKPAPAFLESQEVFKRAQVRWIFDLDEFEMPPLQIEKVHAEGLIKNGQLSGLAQIQKIFEGSVTVNPLKINLFEENPWILLHLQTKQIRIEKMNAWLFPPFEKLIQGGTDLQAQVQTHMPGTPDFLNQITAQGQLKLKEGQLNTVAITEILKETLDKIPGFKKESLIERGPFQASMDAQFQLQKGIVRLTPFQGQTPRHEELSLTGTLGLDMNVNLQGHLSLVDLGSGSFFEANKDAKGRVEFPLKIKGSALKPEFSMVQETVQKMLMKTAQYEGQKLLKKTQDQAQDQIQKELNKQKEQLGNDVKKKLQDLFK